MTTHVFLSWSGARSKKLATYFKSWLQSVLQNTRPWMSEEDIPRGTRWGDEVKEGLTGAAYGIVFATRENLEAPWLQYEAGALSNTIGSQQVCPYLLGLSGPDIPADNPLAHFQASRTNKTETLKLVQAINSVAGDAALETAAVETAFEMWWPKLEVAVRDAEQMMAEEPALPIQSDRELLEESVELLRSLDRRLSVPKLTGIGRAITGLPRQVRPVFTPEEMSRLGRALEEWGAARSANPVDPDDGAEA